MKKFFTMLLAAVMMLSLTACGEKKAAFDPQKYVEAALEAKFYRDYDAYAEQTGVTVEEAKKQLESEFEDSLREQLAATGIQATEEQIQEYFALEAEIRANVKFEVGTPVEDEDGNYTVRVTVTPYAGYYHFQNNFMTDLQNAVNEGATEADYMDVLLESLRYSIDNPAITAGGFCELHLTYEMVDGVRMYTIEEDDVYTLDLVATGQM